MSAQPEQPQIGPQPVMQQVSIGAAQTPAGAFVVLQITGPTGVYVAFFDPESATAVAKQLTDTATTARTGLVVANGLRGLNGNGKH